MKTITCFLVLCTIPLLVFSLSSGLQKRSFSFAPEKGKCLGFERTAKCGEEASVLSCVCYKNGTCYSDYVDRCTECHNKKVKSVTEGCCASDSAAPPSIDGVCSPDDRKRRCFAYNPEPSCVCYMDGTCEDRKADRCGDCANKKIYSINKGSCKSKQLTNAGDICQHDSRNVNCFAYIPTLTCACYFDGACKTQFTDRCGACNDPMLASISKGCCPVKPVEKCRSTPLDQCPVIDGRLVKCANIYNDGCICYKNGTCIEGPVNSCIQCQQEDVFGVEVGSKCPCKGVFEAQCVKQSIDKCPVRKSPSGIMCTQDLSQGCVCYEDGTCEEKMMNTCNECHYTKNVVAAQKGTKCPCPGYQK
mmetsp:Transcript_54743/g.62928  ORF Transcript_54743/g.62928 Transcript_54743/m.62928 type:complete len:360 (+) Transcript_54743:28-1107(+)